MELPEHLRKKLLDAGHTRLEFGDISITLGAGEICREVFLDGASVGTLSGNSVQIDWSDVETLCFADRKGL